jgi:hypothetical protein
LPPGFEATSVATSRWTSGIEYAPAVIARTLVAARNSRIWFG